MADDKNPDGKKDDAPAGPKLIMGFPLPQVIFALANVLVMIGGLYFIITAALLYKKPPITDSQAVQEIQKKEEKAPLDIGDGYFTESYPETTITLRGQRGGKNRYATVEVSVVCGSELCLSQVKGNKAKIEDAIQTAVGNRSYTELGSLDVKFRVKHEILSTVNGFLEKTAATDILFTNFVVQ
ncbi:MAG: flagellar basal body-associated FliL family protein [Proteobacteria bacterium]|nr:MAG: flagellar basal body-associated FliL family protein [Pseudomonadota bacterium]